MKCFLLIAILWLCQPAHADTEPVTPAKETLYTSTRYVTSLLVAPNGDVWAGTLGGILQRAPNGTWRKFTQQDGLPGQETRGLTWQNDTLYADFPTGTVARRHGHWEPTTSPSKQSAAPNLFPDQTCAATWQERNYIATPRGLYVEAKGQQKWQPLAPPACGGTHVSALLPQGALLWAALFGDGVWAWNGRAWQKVNISLPDEAREITALAGTEEHLWVGTRRAGIWERQAGTWRQHLLPDEPFDVNCQALCMVGEQLWVSSLEDGLAVRSLQGWQHLDTTALSHNAPRQSVVFQDATYLRFGNGSVDKYDGAKWERNICGRLQRNQVFALCADEHRLYVGQWGGWSEFDGQTWTSHLDLPELQGLPITALCPQSDTLWIGMQSRGMAQYQASSKTLRWHDERLGLPDDWVTVLACIGGKVYAGTFVGGLAAWDGKRWQVETALKGENVTALEPDNAGGLYVATRKGVWHRTQIGELSPVRPSSGLPLAESQALCAVPEGLWIGTRTGLLFCPKHAP